VFLLLFFGSVIGFCGWIIIGPICKLYMARNQAYCITDKRVLVSGCLGKVKIQQRNLSDVVDLRFHELSDGTGNLVFDRGEFHHADGVDHLLEIWWGIENVRAAHVAAVALMNDRSRL
jgi:hypothetical protein